MKQKDIQAIEKNLKAYLANFEPIFIKQGLDKAFYVCLEEKDVQDLQNYVQRCENVDYLNGWLNGAIQAKNRRLRPKNEIDFDLYNSEQISELVSKTCF